MANEFIIRKGYKSLSDSQITGSLSVSNAVTASFFTGSFRGDGSELTGIDGFPFTGSASISGSLTVVGPVTATEFIGNGSQLTGIEGFPYTGSAIISGSLQVTGSISTDTDATINSLTVGKGGGNLDTNTAVGYNAFSSNTGGNFNVAIGYNALASNVEGDDNVAIGYNALSSSLASMGPNTAVGRGALQNNLYGFRNTAIGNASLFSNIQGDFNTAVGNTALLNNIDGHENIAIGDGALYDNTVGDYNTGVGTFAIHSNTGGNNNTAIGHSSLYNNLTGSNNIAIGTDAGLYAGSGFTGLTSVDNSIFVGYRARALNTTGDTNEIVIGHNIVGLGSNTTVIGNNNTVSTTLKGAVSASLFSGSFVGDGSQLTGIADPTPITATIDNTDSPFTITNETIVIVDSTNGNVTINLPDLDTIVGTENQKPIVIYKNDYSQNVVFVSPNGSQLVNGTTQDIIVSIQIGIVYNPTSAGWVTEGNSYQSLAELELFFVPRTETGSLSVATASYVEYTDVVNKPTLVSGSSQISFNGITNKPTLISGSSQVTYSGLTGIPAGIVSSSAQVSGYNVFATNTSNVFQGNQTITGSLFITQNLVVAGSSSIQYITSSNLDIADNIITVNVLNPSVRFGGIGVIDSGSNPQRSGSLLFDSIKDEWIFVHQNQSIVTSSVLLMGPETYNNLGNETYLSANRLPKGSGVEHLRDSNISDTGTIVSVNSNTQVTGSLTVSNGVNVTGTGTFSSTLTLNGSNNVIRSGNELRFNRADNAIYTRLYDAGSLAANGFILDNVNGEGFHFQNNGTTIMRMNSSGNVGIGLTGPSTKLHIYEPATNSTAYLTIQNNRARNAAVYTQTTNGGFYAGTSIGTDTFNYQIYDGVAGTARLTISSTGAATFSSSVTATANSSGRSGFFGGASFGLRIDNSGSFNNGGTTLHGVDNTFVASYQKLSLNGSSLEFMTDFGTKLTIANNGTSTFSSNVIATGGTEIPNGQFYRARRTSSNLLIDLLGIESGTDNTRLLITGDLNIKNGSLDTLLNITTTGVATFSSSVGIGIAPNNGKLHIVTPAGADFQNAINLEKAGGYGNVFLQSYYVDVPNYGLGIRVGDTTRMIVNGAGNVGIGTASPNIYNLSNTRNLTLVNDAGYGVIASVGSSGNGGEIDFGISTIRHAAIASLNGSNLGFYTNGSNSGTGVSQRMLITSGGDVLIGTATSSGDILTIAGNINLTSGTNRRIYIGSASNYYYRIRTDGDDFVISEAAVSDRLRYSYGNTRWEITGGLSISGALSKGSGSFRIDHPLPSKKNTHHLVHSFIEGPQADNIYRGKIQLVNGKVTINLDQAARMTEGTFVLLNGNIQCFTSNESGWTAVKGIVEGNILTIEAQDTNCADTVSWLVVGERIDQHMLDTDWTDENGKVITEPLKQ